ncbi:DUF4362 domain-containing protein [Actinoplanes sp. M2I2]|uniref:DUF4362 domain-containing protein n=1 Tax=Actinoplanes sp. M2I2 TaxID=1734444 RepID=UPI002020F8BA|nr:DUF4362 domain-containing protein [Actinoplanes sp. M2I2]
MKRLPTVLATPFLLVGALSACTEGGSGPGPAGTSPAVSASAEAPLVDPTLGRRASPGWTEGPSTTLSPGQGMPAVVECGDFDLDLGDTLPDRAARCFVDAAQAGHPARLRVTRLTTEGDPIPVTYTAGADGLTEVVTDTRQDAFGSKVVTRETCQGPSPAAYGIDFTKCT